MDKKKLLRKYYLEQRKNIADKKKLSEIIISHIKLLEIYEKARTPVLYYAAKNEVLLFGLYQKFGLPRCIDKNGEMEIYWANLSEMSPDAHGILSPLPLPKNSILPEEIDLIFVPAVAFDVLGNRLGQGGGYYDRFLPKCKNAVKIGVCFSCQISENFLPADKFDEKVDFIISEKGIIKC